MLRSPVARSSSRSPAKRTVRAYMCSVALIRLDGEARARSNGEPSQNTVLVRCVSAALLRCSPNNFSYNPRLPLASSFALSLSLQLCVYVLVTYMHMNMGHTHTRRVTHRPMSTEFNSIYSSEHFLVQRSPRHAIGYCSAVELGFDDNSDALSHSHRSVDM